MAAPSEDGRVRIGYSIGRRVGTAVERNRRRRQLRALVAGLEWEPGVYLIGCGPTTASYGELRRWLSRAADQLSVNKTPPTT